MQPHPNTPTLKIGYWSAILATIFSLLYIIGQLAEWLNLFNSGGGPENASTPTGLTILMLPSLLLGIAFPILMTAIHYYVPKERKLFSHLGIVFAAIYSVLICMNYFIQLTLVVPHMLTGETASIQFLLFKPFDSFLYSVDILGYSFMSLSILFAAFAFSNKDREKTVRAFMIANGLLIPFLALQNHFHFLIWGGSLWAITFPGTTITLAVLFKKASTPAA
ncbi:MAG: hypothetical protein J7621_30355 [Niastella sp.]|nr:hypothetical protein [Niastella sp.]